LCPTPPCFFYKILGGGGGGAEEGEREHRYRLIYINNCLTPELEWFNVKLARCPTEPEVEVRW
jgi:hypothetical protein